MVEHDQQRHSGEAHMLDELHSVPLRIAALKCKLAARAGKAEYKENCASIRAEIDRLEAVSKSAASVTEFIQDQAALASGDASENSPK